MSDALFYLFAIAVMYLSYRFLKQQRTAKAMMRAPQRQDDAARYGWSFETEQTMMFEILRWRGTSNGVSWVAETLRSGTNPQQRGKSVTRILRWYAERPLPVPTPVAMLRGKGLADEAVELPSEDAGVMGKLGKAVVGMVLDKAFDVQFGKAVLRGMRGALVPVLAAEPPVSVLFTPGGLAVSTPTWIDSADDLKTIVDRGTKLVRAVDEHRGH